MGKNTSQSTEKISKKRTSTISTTSTCTDNKRTLNSLIRVLKPKVYITDSSTFKALVQQLTGNEMITSTIAPSFSSSPNYSSIISEPADDQQLITTMIEEQYYATSFQESSPEMSFDSSELIMSAPPTTFGTSDLSQDHLLNMTTTFLHHDQQFDQSFPPQYGDMDLSWLLDGMDTPNFACNYYDPCAIIMPPKASVYDYDMSGIM